MWRRKSDESTRPNLGLSTLIRKSDKTDFRVPHDKEKEIENNLIKDAALTIKKLDFNKHVYDSPKLESKREEQELESEKRKLYSQLSARKRE